MLITVFHDVVQGFLHQTVRAETHRVRHLGRNAVAMQLHRETSSLGEPLAEAPHRGLESHQVDDQRVQVVRDPREIRRDARPGLAERSKLLASAFGNLGAFGELIDLDQQQRHLLPDVVVQLAGDAAALVLLCVDQAAVPGRLARLQCLALGHHDCQRQHREPDDEQEELDRQHRSGGRLACENSAAPDRRQGIGKYMNIRAADE